MSPLEQSNEPWIPRAPKKSSTSLTVLVTLTICAAAILALMKGSKTIFSITDANATQNQPDNSDQEVECDGLTEEEISEMTEAMDSCIKEMKRNKLWISGKLLCFAATHPEPKAADFVTLAESLPKSLHPYFTRLAVILVDHPEAAYKFKAEFETRVGIPLPILNAVKEEDKSKEMTVVRETVSAYLEQCERKYQEE